MSIVTTVLEKPGRDGGSTAILMMDDGTEIWTPDYAKALPLLNKPIPEDWFQKEGDYGPQAFPPRPKGAGGKGGGGGMAAWRNTKEGFAAEQAGRLRWQQVEEERRDRRTALMQAVQHSEVPVVDELLLERANRFYNWLRTSPAPTVLAPAGAGGQASAEGEAAGDRGPGGVQQGASSPASTAPPGSTITQDYPADWPQDK